MNNTITELSLTITPNEYEGFTENPDGSITLFFYTETKPMAWPEQAIDGNFEGFMLAKLGMSPNDVDELNELVQKLVYQKHLAEIVANRLAEKLITAQTVEVNQ